MSEDRYLLVHDCTEEKHKIIEQLGEDYEHVTGRKMTLCFFKNASPFDESTPVCISLEFEKEHEYELFLQYVYEKYGSIHYPTALEWLPISKEEFYSGEVPNRETPIYKEGEIVDQYGLQWYPERIEKYREKYKGFRIKNFSKYRESLDGQDLYVTTEDGIEEVDPIIVKFPYYANK